MNVEPARKSRALGSCQGGCGPLSAPAQHVTRWRLLDWLATRKVILPSQPSSLSSLQGARHGFDGDGSWIDLALGDLCFASVVAVALWNQYYGVPVAIGEKSCTGNFSTVIDKIRVCQMQTRTGDGECVQVHDGAAVFP